MQTVRQAGWERRRGPSPRSNWPRSGRRPAAGRRPSRAQSTGKARRSRSRGAGAAHSLPRPTTETCLKAGLAFGSGPGWTQTPLLIGYSGQAGLLRGMHGASVIGVHPGVPGRRRLLGVPFGAPATPRTTRTRSACEQAIMAVEELDPRSDGRVLKLAELLRDAAS